MFNPLWRGGDFLVALWGFPHALGHEQGAVERFAVWFIPMPLLSGLVAMHVNTWHLAV